MTDPWKCPDCGIWQAPTVTSHRCEKQTQVTVSEEPKQPPGYSGHNGGSFERQPRHDFEPSPRWGFRP